MLRWLLLISVPLLLAFTHALSFVELDLRKQTVTLITRVCAHEDSRPLRRVAGGGTAGEPTEDCLGILQTTLTFQDEFRYPSPYAAIRALAPHVTGAREGSARHRAYGALPAFGLARPAAWNEARHGSWELHGPYWGKFRERMEQIAATGFEPPCPGKPIHWGNADDLQTHARKRGLCVLACGERNHFVARPGEGCTEPIPRRP
jgi:hypothetical protein